MDSRRIEAFAVTAVEDRILNAGNFNPVFNKNDTLPSWDGEIFVYKGDVQSKDELIEVIPVQIKGTTQDKRKGGNFSYSVEVSDLKNYLNCKSGSVLYFVVFLEESEATVEKYIYYNKLLPYDLKLILSQCENQDRVSLEFKLFPHNKNEINDLLNEFIFDMKLQKAHVFSTPISMEEVVNARIVPIVYLRQNADTEKEPSFLEHLGKDFYGYISRQDNIQQPVFHGILHEVFQYIPTPIMIKSEMCYPSYRAVDYVDRKEFIFSDGIKFILPKNEYSVLNLQYVQRGRIAERLNDIRFLTKLKQHKEFSIGSYTVPYDVTQAASGSIKFDLLNDIVDLLSILKKFVAVLDVREEPNIEELRKEDILNLIDLTQVLISGSTIKMDCASRFVVNNYEIAGLNVLVFAELVEGSEGGYRLKNFNDVPNVMTMVDEDGIRCLTSIYAILNEDDFLHVSNINFDKMLHQLQSIPISKGHSHVMFRLVAHMLLAYDKSGDKRKDILKTAIQLAEWLEKNDSYSSQICLRLNKYDAIKRMRDLNEDEESDLLRISEDSELHYMLRTMAHLLLGHVKAVDYCFSKLSQEEKEICMTYPVWRFKNSPLSKKCNR